MRAPIWSSNLPGAAAWRAQVVLKRDSFTAAQQLLGRERLLG
jgi:hypothetical protein